MWRFDFHFESTVADQSDFAVDFVKSSCCLKLLDGPDEVPENLMSLTPMLWLVQSHSNNDSLETLADLISVEVVQVMVEDNTP